MLLVATTPESQLRRGHDTNSVKNGIVVVTNLPDSHVHFRNHSRTRRLFQRISQRLLRRWRRRCIASERVRRGRVLWRLQAGRSGLVGLLLLQLCTVRALVLIAKRQNGPSAGFHIIVGRMRPGWRIRGEGDQEGAERSWSARRSRFRAIGSHGQRCDMHRWDIATTLVAAVENAAENACQEDPCKYARYDDADGGWWLLVACLTAVDILITILCCCPYSREQ